MPHLGNHSPAVAHMGGKHLQEHMLGFDTTTSIRNSEQRSADAVSQTTVRTGNHGHGQPASDEASNDEDDEDSSGEKDDEAEDPEVVAPPHGIGLGKGKRPVIRIEPAGDDESQEEMEGTSSRGVGQKTSNPVNQFLMRNKKRTFSNISNNSVLFGEDNDLSAEVAFPRRKLARRLSTNSAKGLLTYLKDGGLEPTNKHANAVESSDDEEPEKTVDLDDEDYSGVNLISDESDIEQMEKQEEEWLINDAQQSADLFSDARRLSLDSSASDNYFQPGIPISEDFFETTNQFPDVGFGQFFEPDIPPTSPEPAVSRKYSDSSTKRVRFDDEVNMSDSSSTSSSEWDTSWWPDLFEKDKLPPNLYQMIENEHDVNIDSDFPSSGSERSYWDFGQDDNGSRLQNDSDDYDDSESEPGSSGYETDMGDTTDEYDSDFASPPPQTPQQKSVLRRPSSAPGSRAATPKPYQRSTKAGTGKFIPPVCGVFIHGDRNKAIAVTNRDTKTVAFYRPRTTVTFRHNNFAAASSSTSTAQNSPRSTLQQLGADDSDFHDAFNSPFPNSTDIMFTGIFGAAPNSDILALLNGSSVGPPEAFYPFVSVNQNGTIAILSDEDGFGTEDAEIDDDINLEDFMDFGPEGDETDVEQEDSTDAPATPSTSLAAVPSSTPAHPINDMTPSNRKRTASDVMLEHFDRGVVTAFRNNQNHYRSLARLPHDPDLRASVSRPIRSGRSAETLMSPLRKRSVITKRMNGTVLAGISKASGKMDSRIMTSQHGPRAGTFS